MHWLGVATAPASTFVSVGTYIHILYAANNLIKILCVCVGESAVFLLELPGSCRPMPKVIMDPNGGEGMTRAQWEATWPAKLLQLRLKCAPKMKKVVASWAALKGTLGVVDCPNCPNL